MNASRNRARSANLDEMRCFIILIVALLLPPLARADVADAAFRNGLTAFNEGSYARAQEAWVPLATARDMRGQTGLGFTYYSGRCGTLATVRSAAFFQSAAALS